MSEQDDIRTAYQSAIDMASHEGDGVWARFNVILVANSILLLALTTATRQLPENWDAILSLAGIVLCIMWLLLMKRGFTYETYYVITARVLEQKLANGSVRTLSNGKLLAEGKLVIVDNEKLQMSLLAKLNARFIVNVVIGVFIAAYILLWFKEIYAVIIGVLIYIIVLLGDRMGRSC
ncbi:MAG: hypothetical protein HYZ49_05000 [Chloroflexi bacterium]|nr:hypothetical protein [Chloroflexota bacterium]